MLHRDVNPALIPRPLAILSRVLYGVTLSKKDDLQTQNTIWRAQALAGRAYDAQLQNRQDQALLVSLAAAECDEIDLSCPPQPPRNRLGLHRYIRRFDAGVAGVLAASDVTGGRVQSWRAHGLALGGCTAEDCNGGEIAFWSLTTQQFTGATLSPDGKYLAVAMSGGPVEVSYVTLPDWEAQVCSIANRNLTQTEWRQFFPVDQPYQKICGNLPGS